MTNSITWQTTPEFSLLNNMPFKKQWKQWNNNITNNKILICSDSLSALQSTQYLYSNLSIVQKKHDLINKSSKSFKFLWIPSHAGIRGNEKADLLAKNHHYGHEEIRTFKHFLNPSTTPNWSGIISLFVWWPCSDFVQNKNLVLHTDEMFPPNDFFENKKNDNFLEK